MKTKSTHFIERTAAELRPPTPEELEALREPVEPGPDLDPPEITEEQFARATTKPMQLISLRVEQEVLDWFKAQGPGYQSRIREAMREYMDKRVPTEPPANAAWRDVAAMLQQAKAVEERLLKLTQEIERREST